MKKETARLAEKLFQNTIVMRFTAFTFFLLLGASFLTAQDIAPSAWQRETAGWKPFLSEGGRFQVLTPAPMQERVDSAETPLGLLKYHAFICRDGADLRYVVSYVEYPEDAVHEDSTELLQELFQATLEEALSVTGGELAFQENAEVAGYPGRIWRINVPETRSVIRTRVFVAGSRFYTVQTVSSRNKALNPSADRFLSSFRLLL